MGEGGLLFTSGTCERSVFHGGVRGRDMVFAIRYFFTNGFIQQRVKGGGGEHGATP